MTPKCCKECKYNNCKRGCDRYDSCGKWLDWFGREWSGIRKAARLIIEKRELRQVKMEEYCRELREEGYQ